VWSLAAEVPATADRQTETGIGGQGTTCIDNAEHNTYDSLPQLAQSMELADQDGLLVVDLTSASIGAATAVDETEADVRLTVAEGSDIVVRTVEVSEGEWRVAQLVLDGLEPDLSGPPILRRTCPLSRVVTLEGVECPEAEREGFSDVAPEDVPADVQAEIDRLRAEAGTDINAQIAIAGQIAELLEPFDARMKRPTDAEICGAMQGVSDALVDWESVGDTRDRADALLGTTCPGSIDRLFTYVGAVSTVERFPETSLYGGLPLNSPEASVNAFFESWANEAYLSAYLVLSPRAQSAMSSDGLLTEDGRGAASLILDHGFPVMWAVANLEETASIEGAHRLGSSDDVKIESTSSIAWLDNVGDPIEGRAVDVVVDGVPYTVAVTESPSGRWRVAQIVRAPDDPNPSGSVFPAEA